MPQSTWDLIWVYLYAWLSITVFIAMLIDCVRDGKRFLPRKRFDYD